MIRYRLAAIPLWSTVNNIPLPEWNTIYIQVAFAHIRSQDETLNDEDIASFSPLCHGYISTLGHYTLTLEEQVKNGHLKPLKATY